MDEKILAFIREDLSEIKSDIKSLETEVKDLSSFKWKLIGISSTISFIFAVVLKIYL